MSAIHDSPTGEQSTDIYRSTFEIAAVGIAHVAPDGRWLRVNHAVCEITGYSSDELLHGSFQQITHPDDLSLDLAQVSMLLAGKTNGYRIDKRYIRRDGSLVWVSLTVTLLRHADGAPNFFVAVIKDISARKQAEASRLESEARFRAIFDSAVEAIAIIDATGTIESVNPGVERMFGYTPAELVGRNVTILMPAAIAREHDRYLERYRAGAPPAIIGIGREVFGRRKDGSSIPLDLSVAEWELDGRRYFTGMMRDLTPRKIAESALQRSEERFFALQSEYAHLARVNDMGEMAAAIAHEINQPLTAIVNYLGAGMYAVAGGPDENALKEIEEIMAQASQQALRAGEIVRRLREFIGKGTGERQIVKIDALIEAGSRLALIDAAANGIAVERVSNTDGALVHVDPIQLQQVLVNILRNAQDALVTLPRGQERKLTIMTRTLDGNEVEIWIGDTGPGIAPEVRAALFDPFVTSKPAGMGMGLSVCRRLMEAHGGTIRLQETGSSGTIFALKLPVEHDAVVKPNKNGSQVKSRQAR
ncbi:two-component system sensor kinase FixL [Sphingomonas kyeonggiensis]|uniref:Sensor protein FixL n=1 Tax=Sphingomonas kyeonggiensis TaxID=1268553 RepID=A0A7W7K5D6_9SPHN|nr:PAS domain S-box protein [Sphingomonas kyeonggiensis]MBB4841283.1 two-component system sensor kinase FixL [Sphingomonas kyeonggiensis]